MKTNGKAFKTCCVAEKSFFYRVYRRIGLCTCKLCCEAHHCMVIRHFWEIEWKILNAPAVREDPEYIWSWHKSMFLQSLLWFNFSFHLSWAFSLIEIKVICERFSLSTTNTILSKSIDALEKDFAGWDPVRSFRDSQVCMHAKTDSGKRGNAMWGRNNVLNLTA